MRGNVVGRCLFTKMFNSFVKFSLLSNIFNAT